MSDTPITGDVFDRIRNTIRDGILKQHAENGGKFPVMQDHEPEKRGVIRGVLASVLVLDWVEIDGKEARVAIPKGQEVEVRVGEDFYSEATRADIDEARVAMEVE